jgi:ComF family protein
VWQKAVDLLVELVAPSRCASCGEASRALFCAACGNPSSAPAEQLLGLPLITAGLYAPPLQQAIRRYKYGGCPELARGLAALLSEPIGALELSERDAFVPVPLHPKRLAERGYDQAALVARALARMHRARFVPRLLERVRDTSQQASLDRSNRDKNIEGAFRQRQAFGSGRLVLVDDVLTTGATIRACLQALAQGGSRVLAVAAVARALPGRRTGPRDG